MKINEVLPDLEKALEIPNTLGTRGPTGTKKPLTPGEKRQQQQGSQFGKFRKPGSPQGQQTAKTTDANKLRPGQKITLPTDQGDEQEFRITRDLGNEVEIENPDGLKNPNQPNKVVYKKSDLEKALGNKR